MYLRSALVLFTALVASTTALNTLRLPLSPLYTVPSTGSLGLCFGVPRLTPENGDPTSGRDTYPPLPITQALTFLQPPRHLPQHQRLRRIHRPLQGPSGPQRVLRRPLPHSLHHLFRRRGLLVWCLPMRTCSPSSPLPPYFICCG